MRRSTIMTLGAAAILILSACTGPPTAEPETEEPTTPTATEAPATATDAPATATEAPATPSEEALAAVLAELDGLDPEQRRTRLVELAQEEGSLSIYTSMSGPIAQELADTFEDEFDVNVGLFRASSEDVQLRILQERDANFSGADVVETNGTEMFVLGQEGALVPVDSPVEDALAEGAEFDTWTATRFNFFAAAWNTDLVSPDEVPTRWEDFADPIWDGRIAFEAADADWYLGLTNYWLEEGKTQEEIDQLFQDMVDGSIAVSGHTLMSELLSAGEYSASTSNYSYIVQGRVNDGAPVAWEPAVEPVIARPNGIGLVAGMPHPAAAMLFFDWILSDGQEFLVENAIDASRRDLLSTGDAEVTGIDLAAFTENRADLEAEYEELMRAAEVSE